MSATDSQTATTNQSNPPITIFTRFATIPLISSSLESINDVLTNNTFTRSPYAHAKVFSSTAYKFTEPIQVRLAPLIVPLDGFANKAVDVVEARYPYPFQAQPGEVVSYVIDRKNSTISEVNKAIDHKVMTPAANVAQGIDQSMTPIVDYFEHAVSKLNLPDAGPSTSPDAKYQYQRALALSKTVSGNVYEYTNEQLRHLQAQSAFAQKASDTAQAISGAAASSLSSAHSRIHTLSDTMIQEIHKLQASTWDFATSLQTGVQGSASHKVAQIQQAFASLSGALSTTAQELSSIITQKDLPVQEKMSRVAKEVQNRVTPLLDTLKNGVSEVLARSKETTSDVTNGHADQ